MESENLDPGRARGSPIEDTGFKDLVLSPAAEREIHRRRSGSGDSSSAHVRDEGGGSVGAGDNGDGGRVVNVLDILVKGSPPPTSGDPSPGRNHVIGADSRGMGFGDGVEEDGGRVRVVLVESLAKGSKFSSPGESSKRRNSVSTGAAVSVLLQSPSDAISGYGADDCEERTTSTSDRNPDIEGQ